MSARTERAVWSAWTPTAVAGLLRHRALLLGIVAVISVIAGVKSGSLRFESEMWFLEDDPELAVYREFRDRFQADEIA